MTPFAIIPGFATEARFSVLRDVRGPDAGFTIFYPLVAAGQAAVFRWGISRHFGFLSCFTGLSSLALYRAERLRTAQPDVQQGLAEWLHAQQPRVIVCHSLGCLLLTRMLAAHHLPSSVQKIILNQGDLSPSDVVTATARTPHVAWIHTYCPWDPSLLFSSLLAREVRAGLIPITHPRIAARMLPLWRPLNLHMSAMRDPRLRKLAQSQDSPPLCSIP